MYLSIFYIFSILYSILYPHRSVGGLIQIFRNLIFSFDSNHFSMPKKAKARCTKYTLAILNQHKAILKTKVFLVNPRDDNVITTVGSCLNDIYQDSPDIPYQTFGKWLVKWKNESKIKIQDCKRDLWDPMETILTIIKDQWREAKVPFIDEPVDNLGIANMVQLLGGDSFIFKSADGIGYYYNVDKHLWQEKDKNEMITIMCESLNQWHVEQRIRYTDEKLEKKFLNAIRNVGPLNGVLTIFAAWNVRKDLCEKMNASEVLFPIGFDVIDLRTLEVRRRTDKDYFSITTERNFLGSEFLKGELKNVFEQKTQAEQDKEMETVLKKHYPRAHKYMENTLMNFDRRTFMRRRLSLGLTCLTIDRSYYFCTGMGMGGKSDLQYLVNKILGKFSGEASKYVIVKAKTGDANAHSTHIAQLKNLRHVIIGETDKGDKMNEGQTKKLCDGSLMAAREVFGRMENFFTWAKIFILTNWPAILNSEDSGNRDRLKACLFNTRFWQPNHKESFKPAGWDSNDYKDFYDPVADINWIKRTKEIIDFSQKMKTDEKCLDEFFSYLVLSAHECIKLVDDPYVGLIPVPARIILDTDKFFEESDVMGQYIEEMCEVVSDYHTGATISEVVAHYNLYLTKKNQPPWQDKTIKTNLKLRNLYSTSWRTERGMCTRLALEKFSFDENELKEAESKHAEKKNLDEAKESQPTKEDEAKESQPTKEQEIFSVPPKLLPDDVTGCEFCGADLRFTLCPLSCPSWMYDNEGKNDNPKKRKQI